MQLASSGPNICRSRRITLASSAKSWRESPCATSMSSLQRNGASSSGISNHGGRAFSPTSNPRPWRNFIGTSAASDGFSWTSRRKASQCLPEAHRNEELSGASYELAVRGGKNEARRKEPKRNGPPQFHPHDGEWLGHRGSCCDSADRSGN